MIDTSQQDNILLLLLRQINIIHTYIYIDTTEPTMSNEKEEKLKIIVRKYDGNNNNNNNSNSSNNKAFLKMKI